MGFYGNITNTSRTQFVFDRTYSSRYEMDKRCKDDGVYAGRYVLVEYDADIHTDIFKQGLYFVDGQIYTQVKKHGSDFCGPMGSTLVTANDIKDGEVAKIEPENNYFGLNTRPLYIQITGKGTFINVEESDYNSFWSSEKKELPDLTNPNGLHAHIQNGILTNYNASTMRKGMCLCAPPGFSYNVSTGSEKYYMAKINNGHLSWSQINTSEAPGSYFTNFNLDFIAYGTSRGYDSTVWQKVYTSTPDATTGSPNQGRYEKYVMIAELNTVVPTFDIIADAPSITPISPHFDTDSTNIYYRFHWQPQWGFRTKSASRKYTGPSISSNGDISSTADVLMTTDEIVYPSDQKTSWYGEFYNSMNQKAASGFFDPIQKKWVEKENANTSFDAAIYYNKAGFSPQNVVKSQDLVDSEKPTIYQEDIAKSGWDPNVDDIKLSPTGLSGNTYKQHDGLVDTVAQPDTQELSIMLPSLGNAVSDMWDLVYGGRETNEIIKNTHLRNLDIQWEDAALAPQRQGLRLVQDDLSKNGFYLTDVQANTLAGCINSVHDLMGMIIVDKSNALAVDPEKVDSDAIYYFENDGTFKRKHEGFEYTNFKQSDYVYELVKLTADSYFPNFFYLDDEGNNIATGSFNTNQKYYQKKLSEDAIKACYEKINLDGWIPNQSYYKTPAGEYRKETSKSPLEAVAYYSFNKELTNEYRIELGGQYAPYKYYYDGRMSANDPKKFVLSDQEIASPTRVYYTINPDKTKQVNYHMIDAVNYDRVTNLYMSKELVYLYAPGTFFHLGVNANGDFTSDIIKENRTVEQLAKYWDPKTNELKVPVVYGPNNDIKQDPKTHETIYYQYYMVQASDASKAEPIYIQVGENFIQQDGIPNARDIKKYNVKLLKFEKGKYFYIEGKGVTLLDEKTGENYTLDEEYHELTSSILATHYKNHFAQDENKGKVYDYRYYTIEAIRQGAFYTPNTFWYQTPEGNWAKDKNPVMTTKPVPREYYQDVVFDEIKKIYYIPNRYYIYDTTTKNYVLDSKKDFDGTQHYIRSNVYVSSDTTGIYPKGTMWTSSMSVIPASVEIAKRKTKWDMVELTGFARTLNTINGLILRINKLIEFDDLDTRDTRTVQGALNSLNDYLNKFKTLPSSRFMVTDSYGRVDGASWTSSQSYSTTNWQTSHTENNAKSATENRWIYFDLNSNPTSPKIIAKHSITKVNDTTTTSDKNSGTQSGTDKGNNDTTDDTLKIMTPIVDNMGHVVGKNTETITLPYGFKTFKFSNSAAVTNATNTSVNDLVADNTKDTMTLAMSNKWLKFSTEANNDKFYIGHITSGVTASSYGLAKSETIATLDTDNTFEVPYFTVDEAGHVTAAVTNTVTIPENFKNVTVSQKNSEESNSTESTEGTVVADALEDTLTIVAGNKWINLEADTSKDTITVKHYVNAFNQSTATTNLNNADNKTFAVQKISWDKAGHLLSSESRTFTLPYNYKTLSIANSGKDEVKVGATALAPTDGDLVANSHVATASIDTGNRWIQLIANTNDRKVTIVHAEAGADNILKGLSADATPSFGGEFIIPYLGIDQAGHVQTFTQHKVTLPMPSLTVSDDSVSNRAEVITSLGLTRTTGAFTATKKNIGTLYLSGLSVPAITAQSTGAITSNDTINGAFEKAQYQLNVINAGKNITGSTDNKINTAISNLNVTLNHIVDENGTSGDSISATIDGRTCTAITLSLATTGKYGVVKLSNAISSNSEAYAATSQAVRTVYDLANGKQSPATTLAGYGITDAVQANSAISAVTNNTLLKIKYDAKGLITGSEAVTAEDFNAFGFVAGTNTFEYITPAADTETEKFDNKDKTIEWLFKKVASLEARIATLESK